MSTSTSPISSTLDAMITTQGQKSGLSSDQIRAAIAIALAEGGHDGTAIGDNGTSFGPFQFHQGGELDAFASWLGVDLSSAAKIAQTQPNLAVQFALSPGGYLYNSLVAGASQNLSGLNLALYAEQYGQRAAQTAAGLVPSVIANVTSAWTALWGTVTQSKQQPPTQTKPKKKTGTTTTAPPAPTSIIGAINNVGTSIGNIGTSITNLPGDITSAILHPLNAVAQLGEQLFWILFGLALIIAGLWLMVNGERVQMIQKLAKGLETK